MKKIILFSAILAVTVCAATVTQASSPRNKTVLRDIRDHLPLPTLPPFSYSALLLFAVGIGAAVTAKIHKVRSAPLPDQSAPYAADTLALLSEAYEKGGLPATVVCERLAGLIGARLVAGSALTMTSTEVILAANETFPDDVITAAKALLELCDRVRFGGFRPDTTVIALALAETQLLLQRLPGIVP